MRIPFEKWEGLGNDFVLLDTASLRRAGHGAPPDEAIVRALCDRHRGVGADGVLLVELGAAAPPVMVVLNADGSRPEMCGNGLRCVAAYAAERTGAADASLVVRTDAGERRCVVRRIGASEYSARVAMGAARIGRTLTIAVAGRSVGFLEVSVGNPHAVSFDSFPEGGARNSGGQPAGADAGRNQRGARPARAKPCTRPSAAHRGRRLGARRRTHPRLWHRGVRRGCGGGRHGPVSCRPAFAGRIARGHVADHSAGARPSGRA